jgi:ABC-type glutathione transport system ATPase component
MSSAEGHLMVADGLGVSFGSGRNRFAAVKGVSLRLGQGEAIGIVGESGSGKSTLARVAEAWRVHHRCSTAEAREEAFRVLESMGIARHDALKKPRQLSGGQRQRVSVARALSAEPSVLVADEPTSAIDQSAQAQLLNLFNRLIVGGLSIILISHDLAVIRYLARRTYVMREGEFVEAGETEQVFGNPRHAYTRTLIASIPGRQKHGPS